MFLLVVIKFIPHLNFPFIKTQKVDKIKFKQISTIIGILLDFSTLELMNHIVMLKIKHCLVI